ncbi:hypothetical protein [Scleromatobacter humisilvae]|uniref:Uncharacterized protein n=1 Tax=Scleromatobacter humisilvae TaxID=2897159 RepID=A0A9X2C470_9BURK|nr:hypothetical protein [Scleromatobacter humisilvae]MCK9688775.1 hypothetical protein [Scleromatobacter humisilvae]
MTSSFDPVPEPDDRPATVAPAATGAQPAAATAAPVPYRPRPSRWATVFRWWLGLSVVAFFAVALCVFLGFQHSDFAPLRIVIDDDSSGGITINGLSDGGRALLAVGLGFVALLLLLLIPLLILLVVGSVAIAIVCGVGVPLIVLALALAVATSPFWLVGLLVWLILRRRDSHRYAASATMVA